MKTIRLLLGIAVLVISGCDVGYKIDSGAPIYVTWDEGHGRREWPIKGADAATFQVLREDAFARDVSTAYYKWHAIPGANPKTFKPLTELYALDDKRVFFETHAIEGADPSTFTPLAVQWGRDKNDVYLQYSPKHVCDARTFELLDAGWQRDFKCAYHRGARLPNADPSTFTVLSSFYAKDGKQVYSGSDVIAGADSATFSLQPPCMVCGKDKNHCYRYADKAPCEKGGS